MFKDWNGTTVGAGEHLYFQQIMKDFNLQGKRNKHTEDHPYVEDHQNIVGDQLFDTTQVSCPMETRKVQEPSQQHLPYMSPVLPAHTN